VKNSRSCFRLDICLLSGKAVEGIHCFHPEISFSIVILKSPATSGTTKNLFLAGSSEVLPALGGTQNDNVKEKQQCCGDLRHGKKKLC
jgi:hypothetical protein